MIKTIIKVGITMLFLATTLFAQTTETNTIFITNPVEVSNNYVSNFGMYDFTLTKDGVALLVCKSIPDTKLGDGAVKDCAINEHSNTDEVVHGILKCFLDQLEKAQHEIEIQYNEKETVVAEYNNLVTLTQDSSKSFQQYKIEVKKLLALKDEQLNVYRKALLKINKDLDSSK